MVTMWPRVFSPDASSFSVPVSTDVYFLFIYSFSFQSSIFGFLFMYASCNMKMCNGDKILLINANNERNNALHHWMLCVHTTTMYIGDTCTVLSLCVKWFAW